MSTAAAATAPKPFQVRAINADGFRVECPRSRFATQAAAAKAAAKLAAKWSAQGVTGQVDITEGPVGMIGETVASVAF